MCGKAWAELGASLPQIRADVVELRGRRHACERPIGTAPGIRQRRQPIHDGGEFAGSEHLHHLGEDDKLLNLAVCVKMPVVAAAADAQPADPQ